MKALTISQPYATLIADGMKWIENRTWPTSYRGPLAIHAGKGSKYLTNDELKRYPTGCVIAVANLVACVELSTINRKILAGEGIFLIATQALYTWNDALRHKHAEGPWCWILEDVRKIEHVPIRGAQGLWEWHE